MGLRGRDARRRGSGRVSAVRVAGVGAALGSWRLDPDQVRVAWGPASAPSGGSDRRPAAETLTVAGADEDTLTLAARAAERALAAAGIEPGDVDALCWGTTRPPLAEGPSHALLAAALRCSPRTGGLLCTGSAHAGMEAFLAGVDALAAGSARCVLVVASDAIVPGAGTALEARCGAGAAALVLGPEGPAGVGVRVQRSAPFLEQWRGDGETATRDVYDPRLVRDVAVLPALVEVAEHLQALEPTAWSLPDPDGRTATAVARRLRIDGPGRPATPIGDTGAAAPWLGALPALDAAGRVAVVGHGGGRTSGLLLSAEGPVPGAGPLGPLVAAARPVHYPAVLRARGQLVPDAEPVPMGVPPGSAMHLRGAHEMLGLLGARCGECGTIATPPSVHPTCPACGGTKLETVPLCRTGEVHTFVVNQTMPPPFEAPLPLLVVDLDDGARLMVQGTGDGRGVAVGARVELVLRRYALERGVPVYGYKATVVGA